MEPINPQVSNHYQPESNSQSQEETKGKSSAWLLTVLFLVGGIALLQISTVPEPPVAQTKTKQTPPRPVETIPLTLGKGVKRIQLLGEVEASEKITIKSQVDGVIQQVKVREGDRVTPGMTIAILDGADQQLALAQAKARLAQEKSNLARLQVGTRPEILAQRQAELDAAKAREQEAKDNLDGMIAVQPNLIAQRQAELDGAKAREQEAKDNLKRIEALTLEGALSERAKVEAEKSADAATSERLRAEAALSAEQTKTQQEIAEAKSTLDATISERLRIAAMLAEAQVGPTQEEIDSQKGVVAAAQAAVEQAKLASERATIKAPIAGVVQSREVDTGNYVEGGDAIITLVNNAQLDIFLEVPEKFTNQVKPGMYVELTAPRSLPNWQQRAEITSVVPTANANSRRQLVRVNLKNPPKDLLAGMGIQATLDLPIDVEPSFVIPRDAIIKRKNQSLIYTISQGKAQQFTVEILADMGEKVLITNQNLQANQPLVVSGGEGLKNGAPVKITSP
ncbi:MAG: efflux RND transporter periplasmic adaptor subunit [Moorea sp. SIOASIH]|uniref:efflux RND transporter periplasmic adaptor subunit n=1 Tax=Moorena sp. SIOASIH TaxID=2607817 RepID=UPI0013B837DE|nr:efflux RND transporter periplasmic adaptor subunit [Moorena sp. SIOASIH]NEO37581.1 efflux RND transporter periplasmic adaptor subunit [Moorena sp. SIOASIH]